MKYMCYLIFSDTLCISDVSFLLLESIKMNCYVTKCSVTGRYVNDTCKKMVRHKSLLFYDMNHKYVKVE